MTENTGLEGLDPNPGSVNVSTVTLGKLFNLAVPQFPCLENGHDNGT